MRKRKLFIPTSLAVACAVLLTALGQRTGAAEQLKVGDRVPDVKLQGSDGKVHALRDFTGKQAVVLAWYPKAFTGG